MTRPLGSREHRLMLELLDARRPSVGAAAAGLDWTVLVGTAERCKLLPSLAQRAFAEGARLDDAALEARLRDAMLEAAVYKTRLLAELARAVGLLQAAGIEPVVLKGAALLLLHYPEQHLRHTVDFDLIVAPNELERAVACLSAADYTLAEHAHKPMPDGSTYAESSSARPHAYAPLKGPSGVNVDLHHRLPVSGFEARGGVAVLRDRARVAQLHGVTLHCASDTDLALHLCEHFAVQGFAELSEAPRLIADLCALYPDGPPWGALAAGPPAQRFAVTLTRVLYEAAFAPEPTAPAVEWAQRLLLGDTRAAALPALVSHLWGHAHRISSDLRYRPRYALATWLPSREYLGKRYGVDPRSPRIYPLYASRLWTAAVRTLTSKK